MPVRYVHLLNGRDALDVLSSTQGDFALLLDSLSAEQIERKPADGKWSVREIIAHLADCEIVWGWRLRQIYGEDNPVLQPFDQDNWARSYGSYSFIQARQAWTHLRDWNLFFLRGLTEADKLRHAKHPEMGELTLWTVASIAAGHDLHHLGLLERATKPA